MSKGLFCSVYIYYLKRYESSCNTQEDHYMAFLHGPWKPNVKLDDLVVEYTRQYHSRKEKFLEKEIEDANKVFEEEGGVWARRNLSKCKSNMIAFNKVEYVPNKELNYFFNQLSATQIFEKWKQMETMKDDDVTEIHFRERCVFVDIGFCFVLEVMNVELSVWERHELGKYIMNNILKIEHPKTGSSQDYFAAMDTLWHGFFTAFQNEERDRVNDNGKRVRDVSAAPPSNYTLDGFEGRLRETLEAYLVKKMFFATSPKKMELTRQLKEASDDRWKWFNSQASILGMKTAWKDLRDHHDPNDPDFHYRLMNRIDFCTGFFFMFEVIGEVVTIAEKQKFYDFIDRDLQPYYPGPQNGPQNGPQDESQRHADETKQYAMLDKMWHDFTHDRFVIGIQDEIMLRMKI